VNIKMNDELKQKIEKLITDNKVFLFMKGDPDMPQCGFSSQVVFVLNQLGADIKHFNILLDDEMRQGIKDFSNWPTLPQLFINGKFVGGCDITLQMHESGELKKLLEE